MTQSDPRQTARYGRKRETILESAAQLFNANGLSGTTLADVAQSVGLTTTSVTYYYRRKEDLAAACVTRAIEGLDELLALAEAEPTSPARLRRLIMLYFEMQAQVATGTRPAIISFWDLRALTGPGAETASLAVSDLFRRLRFWFAVNAGPSLTKAEQNARTFLVFSALLYAKEWIVRFDVEDFARCGECFADVLIGGLAGVGRAWTAAASDPPPPRLPITEVSREAFLRAATELVNEQGYRGASVDRISARLSVTKGSFYHHNETKDDLVAQCFERSFEVVRAAHRAAPRALGTGWERLCMIAAALVRYQRSSHGPLLRNTALSAMPESRRAGFIDDFGRLANWTGGIIADGIADQSIRPLDPAVAAQYISGMVNAAAELHHWVRGVTEEEAVTLFAKPALIGIFAP